MFSNLVVKYLVFQQYKLTLKTVYYYFLFYLFLIDYLLILKNIFITFRISMSSNLLFLENFLNYQQKIKHFKMLIYYFIF